MNRAAAKLIEPMRALLIIFAAYTTATLQFIRHAPPSPDLLELTPLIVGLSFLFILIVPVGLLFIADRLIAALDPSGRAGRIFRVGLLAVCGLLTIRALQLYFAPAANLWEMFEPAPRLLLVAIGFGVFAAIIWACAHWRDQLEQFLIYLAPIASLIVLITMVQMMPDRTAPDSYGQPPTGVRAGDGPPVYVLVFDELAYDALAPEGTLDARAYPNFAALAADGVWFDNATSNWFHTTFVLPSLVESLLPVTDEYEVRLYDQYGWVESLYFGGCGTAFACKGAVQVVRDNPWPLTAEMALRTFYEATPRVAEDAIEAPMGLVARALGTALPSVDPRGIHSISEEHYQMALGDIDAGTARGRLMLIHSMLPHEPFIYDRAGRRTTDPDGTSFLITGPGSPLAHARYLQQVQYADNLLGRLVARLKDEGIYDEAVIVVTGDHGLREMGAEPDEPIDIGSETTQVPLIIKAPGISSGVSSVDYQHIDFGATLADVLDIGYGGDSAGVSAFDPVRPDRDKVFYVDEDNRMYWTYVYDERTGQWDLTETVPGPLRDYSADAIVKASDGAPAHAD